MLSEISAALVDDIAKRANAVNERIGGACARAGRNVNDITLIAVTKTFPVERVEAALEAGISDFGENRVQELEEKAGILPGRVQGGRLNWHLVGSLQRNKAGKAVEIMDCFHALDSIRLARALDRRLQTAQRVLPCFVQVNVSGEETKSGFSPGEMLTALDELRLFERLELIGLMTLAAPADNPEDVRPQFAEMRALLDTCVGRNPDQFREQGLSMGMSGDFEVAIEEGATHVRIGTALFGEREL